MLLLFTHSVVSISLWPHGLQHTQLPYPSLSPWVCSNSCPLSRWWNATISSSVLVFSSCPQPFPASGCYPVNWLSASGGKRVGVSASVSVLLMNIQDWFPLGLTGLISLLSRRLSRVFSSLKASVLWCSAFFMVQLSHPYTTTGKMIALIGWTFVSNVSAF